MVDDPSKFDRLTNPTQEELFDLWAHEALEAGILTHVNWTPEQGLVFDGVQHIEEIPKVIYKGTKRERVKIVKKKTTLFTPIVYGPDRIIYWNADFLGVLFDTVDDWRTKDTCYFKANFDKIRGGIYYSVLDVKSPFGGKNSSDVSFAVKRAWIWERYKIFVNKVKLYPIKKRATGKYLWTSTFTPARYFWTDGLTKHRTISNWKPKRIETFLDNKLK